MSLSKTTNPVDSFLLKAFYVIANLGLLCFIATCMVLFESSPLSYNHTVVTVKNKYSLVAHKSRVEETKAQEKLCPPTNRLFMVRIGGVGFSITDGPDPTCPKAK